MSDNLTWRKSSHCADTTCVEIAHGGEGGSYMRDSKTAGGPLLAFGQGAWADFITGIKAGKFDTPR